MDGEERRRPRPVTSHAEPGAGVGSAHDTRGYVERMPVAMGTVTGPDFVWTVANDAYRELSGRSDLIGRPLREVFPEFESQGVFDLVTRVRETGEGITATDFRLHIEVDGVLEERVYDFSWYPSRERAEDGHALHVDILVHNVTERAVEQRVAERATEEAQRRYADARSVVATLQESLLPMHLPVLPELDLAASYLLANDELAAGGDWFDVVARPEGRVALVVGDVVGHGVGAAATMGQLRAVLHDRLLGGEPLTAALAALARFARDTDGATGASVCVVEVDPATGAVAYCTAGHPPPLVATTDGEARFLPTTGARLLGRDGAYPIEQTTLATDEVVVLYSDGLVERPGRSVTEGTVEVRRRVADSASGASFPLDPSPRTVDRITRHVPEMLTRISGYADDITMLAAQRTLPVTPFGVTAPAVEESVADVRSGLADWLDAVGIGDGPFAAVQHTVGELVTNAVVHAFVEGDRSVGRQIEVSAELAGAGVVTATVRDRGRWREPAPAASDERPRRGLMMARQLADDLDIVHDDSGTTVTARLRVGRDAALLPGTTAVARTHSAEADRPFSAEEDGDTIRVAGPVDLVGATQLTLTIGMASQGGARPLRIDLADVTHLSSAGVQALEEVVGGHAGTITLSAPNGSVAQHVLDLVGLDHDGITPST